MNDYSKYVAIPFKELGRTHDGVDCWGLVCLIYQEIFNIELPRYDNAYFSTMESENIENLITQESQSWHSILKGEEKEGDVIVFAVMGKSCHTAIIIDDGRMIHCQTGKNTVIENYHSPNWRQRIRGIYRHDQMMNWTHTEFPWAVGLECQMIF